MEEKFEVHLLYPVQQEQRREIAQKLSGYFRLPAEKLERILVTPGIITKPLNKDVAEKAAQKLCDLNIQVMVVPENLAEKLIFDEPVIEDALRDFLTQIPEVPPVKRFYPETEPSRVSRPVVLGVFSLLFLILTLTFGVSFTQAPLHPTSSEPMTVIPDLPLRYEVMPVNLDKLLGVVD